MQMTPSAGCLGSHVDRSRAPQTLTSSEGRVSCQQFLAAHLACSGFCPLSKEIWPPERRARQEEGGGKHAVGVDEGRPPPGPAES